MVSTHYHGDHTSGHGGFVVNEKAPRIWLTDSTRESALKSLKEKEGNDTFKNVQKLDASKPTEIDLGGRVVKVIPRLGHTNSDVTIEVVDPKVVFCGDLFFNRMFPNYSDATPINLNKYAAELVAAKDTLFVPGHGPVADAAALKSYKEFLAHVESAAKAAFKAGDPEEEASKEFKLPDSLKEWLIWSPDVVKRSCVAWYKELRDKKK